MGGQARGTLRAILRCHRPLATVAVWQAGLPTLIPSTFIPPRKPAYETLRDGSVIVLPHCRRRSSRQLAELARPGRERRGRQGDHYPTHLEQDRKRARGKSTLPGKGASTPVVWGKQIFLTCGVDGQNTVLSLDRAGKTLWQTAVGQERTGKHKKATGSNPSAVTDGEHVFVYFKSGDLACLDFDGKIVWRQNLQQLYGEDTLWWDLGTSPVLTKNAVVVAVMQTGPSYLAAFDKSTGQVSWKEDRNVDAPSEAAQSYSTPLVLQEGSREILVVLGADHVTGARRATGKELWRVGGLNPTGQKFFRSIASPVAADGIVVAPYAAARRYGHSTWRQRRRHQDAIFCGPKKIWEPTCPPRQPKTARFTC